MRNTDIFSALLKKYIKNISILYGFMFKDGFFSTATSAGLRVKKWLSMVIRRNIETWIGKREKLGYLINIKNRNIVDYLGLAHAVSTALVRIPGSTHSRVKSAADWALFFAPGQGWAGRPEFCALDWTSAWYLPPSQSSHSASPAD